MCMREYLNDLLACPSRDIVECFLFALDFLGRHHVLRGHSGSTLTGINAVAVRAVGIWITIKKMLPLSLEVSARV